MVQRFVRFLAATLRVPLWIPLVIACAWWCALFLPNPMDLPDAAQPYWVAFVTGWVAFVVFYLPARIYRHFRNHGPTLFNILVVAGVLHALALAMILRGPLVFQTGRSYAAEIMGVDFWVFPAVFLATWVFLCVLIALYFDRQGRLDTAPARWASVIGACAVLALFAIGARSVAPEFDDVWALNGADRPEPTIFAFAIAPYSYAVPLLGAILAGGVLLLPGGPLPGRRRAFGGLIALLAAANVGIVVGMSALFLPMWKMCGYYMDYAESGFMRLHAAAHMGHVESVLRLVSHGKSTEVQDRNGMTPLQYALQAGRSDTARALLARGADAHARDRSGRTALHQAVVGMGRPGSNLDMVQLLLERGVDVNAAGTSGNTALHAAAAIGPAAVVVLLLAKGADVNAVSESGTPLDAAYAAYAPNKETARLLLDHGAVRATEQEKKEKQRRVDAGIRSASTQPARSCG